MMRFARWYSVGVMLLVGILFLGVSGTSLFAGAKGNLIQIKSMADFDSNVRNASKPALVDFYADWCPPCRRLAPTIEKMASKYGDSVNVCKVNVDKLPQLSAEYKIQGIPAVLMFKDGKVVERMVGLRPEKEYVKVIEANK